MDDFIAKANQIVAGRIEPALNDYHFPAGGLDKGLADTLMTRIRRALDDYERASSLAEKQAALNTIINAVGTQKARHSLYGGAGGSTDQTNPGNPKGQGVSSAADSLRNQARKELKRIRSGI